MVERSRTDLAGLRRSPLSHLAQTMQQAGSSETVVLREIPFLNMVGIRIDPGSPVAHELAEITGLDWPSAHGQVTGEPGDCAVLWQGPDEFLLVTQDAVELPPGLTSDPAQRHLRENATQDGVDAMQDTEASHGALPTLSTHPLTVRLTAAMADSPDRGQVVDLSANRTTLEIAGPHAREVLEKGCPMDLHPRAFPVNSAVSTTLGPVQVVLWRTHPDTWRLMPRSSFAQFVAQWLLDAMTEFSPVHQPEAANLTTAGAQQH
ncbi:sarcosine oxidase subunit gamma [Kocuria sp.]|uniref:sarcosine oxidase subunit gamma n=1 Tax=Kocuria sp. TaxID=1871328 RepID=UPI0026DF9CAD|nr:sarcosine oxidase subunit gamma family protein [Kocuria sp.]MDO5617974.1 sarcosine oxidase subunit gamma family protein [Kocuria sp.]